MATSAAQLLTLQHQLILFTSTAANIIRKNCNFQIKVKKSACKMFGNWRKKLNNAIQEGLVITENLQQQYRQRQSNSAASTPSLDESTNSTRSSIAWANDLVLPPDVNMAAGCNLLAKYEIAWKLLHEANEQNATNAAQVATQIDGIGKRTSAQRVAMTDLITCLSGVPVLVEKLRESNETLQQVNALAATVEEQLGRLEDLCEECELQGYMLHKQCELSQYQQKKMVDLECYRQRVAAEHQEKIQKHEQRLRQIQRERQAVFDDAFREDLQEYKQKGALTKIKEPSTQKVALEEVVLEDAEIKDALEEFLNG